MLKVSKAVDAPELYPYVFNLSSRLYKKKVKDKSEYALLILPFLNKAYKDFNKPIQNIVAKSREESIKEAINIASKSGRVFYLCSFHYDSADDHKDYQGRMYYDGTKSLTEDELKYVNKHNLRTVQWVMDNPVYMITRPHCRHYFVVLPTDEVLNNSVHDLLVKHDMIRPIGKRRTNAIIYAERREFHKGLAEIETNETLQNQIKKDSYLVKKWK